jgi:hypothetical protein
MVPIGLWLGSNLARYLGAALMVLWAGALLWPLFSTSIVTVTSKPLLTLFYGFSTALNLLTAKILLLSKKFATEFAHERDHQPKYKALARLLA